ncbi:MAG TPA: hypothetical protein VF439_00025 [Candidatus Paceibacterota bacterium]
MNALLSTFGIDWHLFIAQAVNFGVLAIALTYLLYKPVLKMIRDREAIVAKGVEDAEAASVKLAEADTESGERLKAAEQQAAGIVDTARAAASDAKAKLLKEAEARAAQVAADAEARAKEASAKALRESEKEIARLAVLAAAKAMAEAK